MSFAQKKPVRHGTLRWVFNLHGSVSYKCWCMLDALVALTKNVSGMTNDQQDGESKVQL